MAVKRDHVYEIVKDLIQDVEGEGSAKRVKRILYLRPQALKIIREHGLSGRKIDNLARPFIVEAEHRNWYLGGDFSLAVGLLLSGGSRKLAERAIAVSAKAGRWWDVKNLATYLGREPSEKEACQVLQAETKRASRHENRQQYGHKFMTDDEVELFKWGSQYIGNTEKLKEIEEAFRARDYDWKHAID